MDNDINYKIEKLQKEMEKKNIDIYIILTSDPHISEYIPNHYKSREYISGFKGSAGILIVTKESALLWVDGRYSIQAKEETKDSIIELKNLNGNNYIEYLSKNININSVIGIDFKVMPFYLENELKEKLQYKNIILLDMDLIDPIWDNRPIIETKNIFLHEDKFCGDKPYNKILKIIESMKENNANYHIISSLDDIAWITNLRGNDIEYNPIFLSYLLIKENESILFVDSNKLEQSAINNLINNQITIKKYDEISRYLESINNATFLIDSSKTTSHIAKIIKKSNKIIDTINPSTLLKSRKNIKEINHIKDAMIQDGIALCNFFMWLEDSINNIEISELDIDVKLREFRRKNNLYISDSFRTIAGFNGNAAMPHYKADNNKFSYIKGDGLLLIDSGAQYKNGTTDITRVIPINNITEEQKRDYTLVLKSHIAMTTTIFPDNIPMPLIDSIARVPLWKEQIDYIHGTGHGIGYFLNVHEGPQVLSYFFKPLDKTRAQEGMITSIEPGIYRKDKWGIRLENLVLTSSINDKSEFGKFLYFETLTLFPFEINCINTKMLNKNEIEWINNYHKEVYNKLSPHLDNNTTKWLKNKTQAI